MILLYLVRHGETIGNLEGRIQGHLDGPLSELGLRQAAAAADRLASESFSAVYSSDLGRARATAEAIAARHGLNVQTTPLLREAHYGVVQGLTHAEIDERFPVELNEWRRDPVRRRPPGAESRESVNERCGKFVDGILAAHSDGDRIVVVGHAGSVRGVIAAACGFPIEFGRMVHVWNASLSILEIGDNTALRLLNDTCHLDNSDQCEAWGKR